MSNYRIIVYNVKLDEIDRAIEKASQEYRERFEKEPKTLTVEPGIVGEIEDLISAGELKLELDRHFASKGTIQVGE